MIKSKLFTTLKIVPTSHLQKIELFIQSPFFNKQAPSLELLNLFSILRNAVLEETTHNLDKSSVARLMGVNEKRLDKLMSYLLNLVKQYIIIHQSGVLEDPTIQLMNLSKFYRKQEEYNLFELNLKKLNSQQQQLTKSKEDFNYYTYLIELEKMQQLLYTNDRKTDLNLFSTIKSMDIYYVRTQLEHLCSLYLQRMSTQIPISTEMSPPQDFVDLIEKKPFLNIPSIQLYLTFYQLLYLYPKDDKTLLNEAIQYLNRFQKEITTHQVKELKTILRSYIIKLYNQGNAEYLEISFTTYRQHLEEGLLYHEGKIRASTFFNLVQSGLRLKEINWVETFIQKHQNLIIGSDNPEDAYHLCLAKLYFAKQDYEATSHLLQEITMNDLQLKIQAKRLEIITYYELESSLLEYKMEAFKVYIFRLAKKLLSDRYKKSNNNFVDILRQLIRNENYSSKLKKIQNRIQQEEFLADREWLQEKIHQLL